ncbi:PAS domain S-box-containing protein [Bradyrhizobium sp. GM22.5]
MFGRKSRNDADAQLAAIGRSQAMIEFAMDGTILTANQNFLNALGYSLDEMKGKKHAMFMPADQRDGAEYKAFWAELNRGEYQASEFKRIAKGGREIWIEASYNPVLDGNGKTVMVAKIATEITEKKIRSMTDSSKIAAIGRAQAVIEFKLDGTIVTANENFCNALGYSLTEIQGKHHSLFMPQAERDGAAYREFWAKLNRGEYQAGEFKRIGKGGREVWILASYNPLLDENGKPFGVAKFATDVTAEKLKNADLAGQISAIEKAQAVIEFNMDGTIITANANFLGALGYSLAEIKGKHHSMFVEPSERDWQWLSRVLGGAQPRPVSGGRIQAHRQGRQGGLYPGLLQSDHGSQRQAVQGREICDRRHEAGAGPHGQRARPRHDGIGRRRIGRAERLGAGDFRGHDQIARDGDERGGAGRVR